MKLSIITGALVALLTGIAIAAQSAMTSRVGGIIGDIRTGILTNTMGGIAAGSLMLIWLLRDGPQVWKIPPVVIGITALSGILGVFIVNRDFLFTAAGWSCGWIGQCCPGSAGIIFCYRRPGDWWSGADSDISSQNYGNCGLRVWGIPVITKGIRNRRVG